MVFTGSFSSYIQLQLGTALILLKVSKSLTTILFIGALTFLGLSSYLMKLLTCLSDITLSTTLKLSFYFFIALSKLTPSGFQIKQK